MKKFLLLFLLIQVSIFSQGRGIRGVVMDSVDVKPLAGAHITLSSIPLDNFPHYTTTDDKGEFIFRRIPPGRYSMEITFLSFEKHFDTINVQWGGMDLDTIYLKRSFIQLGEVAVTEKVIPVEQFGDTLQFNAAAFRTAPGANLEDLVLKLPGIQKEDGVIKAQGEEVRNVLVDGRNFFGTDPNIPLQNLPADVVDRIQLYDKRSDQSEFTGFDDGQTEKTLNVRTRVDRRRGEFGRIYGGYGSDNRYNIGGNYNIFDAEQRVSMLGMINNINLFSFSAQDLVGSIAAPSMRSRGRGGMGGGRGGGGQSFWGTPEMSDFTISPQSGNNDIYAAGINYQDKFSENLTVNGSYFFNYSKNVNNSFIKREYLTDPLQNFYYDEMTLTNGDNFNHRFNARIEYEIDSSNSIFFTPSFNIQDNSITRRVNGLNLANDLSPISSAEYRSGSDAAAYNFSGSLLYRHRFSLQRRTFSASIEANNNRRNSESSLFSLNTSYDPLNLYVDTLDQTTDQLTNSSRYFANLVYTEPIGENSILQFNSFTFFDRNKSDRETLIYDSEQNNYNILDSLTSNRYVNDNITTRGGISYRYNAEIYNITADLLYQRTQLNGTQTFPGDLVTKNTFHALLPSVRMHFRFPDSRHARVSYSINTRVPSIDQLQNTINNSNPLFITAGNPSLREVKNHSFNTSYFATDIETGSLFMLGFSFNYAKDYIGNSTFIATSDTILPNGISLLRGSQFSSPINLGNSISFSTQVNYGFSIDFLKSNMNIFTMFNYSEVPGIVNEIRNLSKRYLFSQSVSLSSNFAEGLDFRISYTPSYSMNQNKLQSELNNNYLLHNASANARITLFEQFFITNQLSYFYNPRVAEGVRKDNIAWNAGIGLRFLENNSGELKLEVLDVLNQRSNISRNITETYIEDRSTQLLNRYFLLTFTYNIRAFR